MHLLEAGNGLVQSEIRRTGVALRFGDDVGEHVDWIHKVLIRSEPSFLPMEDANELAGGEPGLCTPDVEPCVPKV